MTQECTGRAPAPWLQRGWVKSSAALPRTAKLATWLQPKFWLLPCTCVLLSSKHS